MTCKTGEMSVHIPDRWADVDQIWHVHSVDHSTKLLGNGILNLGRCAAWGHTEHSPNGREEPP